jgi:hypothetical protein
MVCIYMYTYIKKSFTEMDLKHDHLKHAHTHIQTYPHTEIILLRQIAFMTTQNIYTYIYIYIYIYIHTYIHTEIIC